jgi:ectoine hydroxylase-related dioxygenase (phytanoyl-CoA dioxygenase family)
VDELPDGARLSHAEDGAELFAAAVAPFLAELRAEVAHWPRDAAGIRISNLATCQPFLATSGPIGEIAARILGPHAQAVRAVLFDKSAATNWSLAWHQDRTICVKRRIDVEGFGPWTTKAGLQHVAPPFDLLSRMVTLRVHLDDVPADNAPLLIAPGSHRFGCVPADGIDEVVRQCGARPCLPSAGDVWLYATPMLHASERAATPTHRRVLQVDFSADALPGGLEWLGVG